MISLGFSEALAERAKEEPKTDAAAMPEKTERNIEVNMMKRCFFRTGRN